MKQKELIWVEVPFSDFSERKIRPALIVSNDDYNSKNSDIVICAITSNIQETDYSVMITQKDLEQGKIALQSRIKADKIMQLDKKLALKAFGKINGKKFEETVEKIKKLVSKKQT